ncbi:hypothetical protein K7X08_020212 [Anisodus acutangulus]|uniref:Uncharacterized protein n=1 Tax=Anisodus acutangulus TaxID=402998 RepID=A0A9Q1RES5_9SOLA|nr:hypothetical protein K7X08_020212 [Anisodus acutangulus]
MKSGKQITNVHQGKQIVMGNALNNFHNGALMILNSVLGDGSSDRAEGVGGSGGHEETIRRWSEQLEEDGEEDDLPNDTTDDIIAFVDSITSSQQIDSMFDNDTNDMEDADKSLVVTELTNIPNAIAEPMEK